MEEKTLEQEVSDETLGVLVEDETSADEIVTVATVKPFTARYFESRKQHETYATFQNGDTSTPYRP